MLHKVYAYMNLYTVHIIHNIFSCQNVSDLSPCHPPPLQRLLYLHDEASPKSSCKNCNSYTEKRTRYPCLKRAAMVAGEKVNQSQDHALGIQMLQRFGTRVLAGTHSMIYSCTIPSPVISTTPTDSKCY